MNTFSRVNAMVLGTVGAAALALGALSEPAVAQEAELCPCSFASAVRTRGFSGAEMRCLSIAVDVANVPPHGYENLQNHFEVRQRNKKGAITKTTDYRLYEQGLLPAADFGGVVRYAPTCAVAQAGKKRVSVKEAAYILSSGEYAACAQDLTSLAQALVAISEDPANTSCDDLDGSGVADEFEPMVPTNPACFDDQGRQIACPDLPG